jgi:hypothetical protein
MKLGPKRSGELAKRRLDPRPQLPGRADRFHRRRVGCLFGVRQSSVSEAEG